MSRWPKPPTPHGIPFESPASHLPGDIRNDPAWQELHRTNPQAYALRLASIASGRAETGDDADVLIRQIASADIDSALHMLRQERSSREPRADVINALTMRLRQTDETP